MQDDHIVNTPNRTEAMAEREYWEKQNLIRLNQARMAEGVPRAVRRVMAHDRDPNSRKAKKELARMERATRRRGLM